MSHNAEAILSLLRRSNKMWQEEYSDPPKWIFRGQSNFEWSLIPKAWRKENNPLDALISKLNNPEFWTEKEKISDRELHAQAWVHAERMAINEFRRSAWNLGYQVAKPDENVTLDPAFGLIGLSDAKTIFNEGAGSLFDDDIGLAQHYGLPTRMLDWSFDPLIAAYFATNEQPDVDAAVWALDANAVNHLYVQKQYPLFSVIRMVIPTRYGNPLIKAQSGVFTDMEHRWSFDFFVEHGEWPSIERLVEIANEEKMYDEDGRLIYDQEHPVLRRIVIPKSEKPVLKKMLSQEGVTDDAVYPLLEKVAKNVSEALQHLTRENNTNP